MKQKLILALATLVPLTLLAVHPLPQPAQSNVPVVVGGTNQIVWHDLRQTNRVWLAKPKQGRHLEALAAIAKFSKKQKHLPHVGLIRFETDERNPKSKVPTNLVEYVVPDRLVQIQDVIPNDPLWTNQWDLAKIQMPSAWGISTGSSNVIVAVIDTGIDFTHPDLQGSLWSNPTNGTHGYQCYGGVLEEGGADVYGHGTHCAGTIAAVGNNAIGIAGENWRVEILSMAFMDQYGIGQDSDVILLIEKLVELKQSGQNIRVASDSWGGSGTDRALTDAFQALEQAGILSVCAAGNYGVNIDIYPSIPGGMTNRGIVTVSASDSSDALASWSNYGMVNVDIAAPGVRTWSTLSLNTNLPLSAPGGYGPLSGTSMAAPHVAGVAALLCALRPAWSVYQVRDALLNRNSYDSLDFGMGQFSTTSGRLNAYRVLTNSPVPANRAPVVYPSAMTNFTGGQTGRISFTAQDADGDPLRYAILDPQGIVPFTANNSASFAAPHYAIPMAFQAYEEATDRNGGGDLKIAVGNILLDPGYLTDRYEIVMRTNMVDRLTYEFGEDYSTNSNASILAWRTSLVMCEPGFVGGNYGGHRYDPVGPNDYAGKYTFPDNSQWSIFVVAQNTELTIKETPRLVLRFGSETNSPHQFPSLSAAFDKTVGIAPLTVHYDFSGTISTNGPYQFYTWDIVSDQVPLGQQGSITFADPGIHTVTFAVSDAQGYPDTRTVIFSALAPPSEPPPPAVILNQVTNLTATASFGTANLRWTDNSIGEDRYLVEASRKSKGFWVVWQTIEIPTNLSSYAYRPAQNGFYRFRVRAAFQLQYSPWSLPSGQVKL